MARPTFQRAWANYPKAGSVTREQLFREIGWDSLIGNANYDNTCAIRISVCLLRCGVMIRSSAGMKALKGPLKDMPIEIGQPQMTEQLVEMWGEPDVEVASSEAREAIGGMDGIASFDGITGYLNGRGGHIDVIDGTQTSSTRGYLFWQQTVTSNAYACGTSCYFGSQKTRFWQLPESQGS